MAPSERIKNIELKESTTHRCDECCRFMDNDDAHWAIKRVKALETMVERDLAAFQSMKTNHRLAADIIDFRAAELSEVLK